MKKEIIIGAAVVVLGLVGVFIFSGNSDTESGIKDESSENIERVESGSESVREIPEWMKIELEDVRTGEKFTIEEFIGNPILMESFAVWCPTCTKQQREVKKLHEEVGDSFVSISLDTDPNEDKEKVREHVEQNGFDWRYAVSPSGMTSELIDEFGTSIISAPSVPMVLICEDGSFRKLESGFKNVEELKEEIYNGC